MALPGAALWSRRDWWIRLISPNPEIEGRCLSNLEKLIAGLPGIDLSLSDARHVFVRNAEDAAFRS